VIVIWIFGPQWRCVAGFANRLYICCWFQVCITVIFDWFEIVPVESLHSGLVLRDKLFHRVGCCDCMVHSSRPDVGTWLPHMEDAQGWRWWQDPSAVVLAHSKSLRLVCQIAWVVRAYSFKPLSWSGVLEHEPHLAARVAKRLADALKVTLKLWLLWLIIDFHRLASVLLSLLLTATSEPNWLIYRAIQITIFVLWLFKKWFQNFNVPLPMFKLVL